MSRKKLIFLSTCLVTSILSRNCDIWEYEVDNRCTTCPSRCSKCINNLTCTECKPGYYGRTCDTKCSANCSDRKCLQENGQCLSCIRGHYFGAKKLCVKCHGNCIECQSEDRCSSCKVGFKGDTCAEDCINCRNGSGCTLETGVCFTGCKDGYSENSCLMPCNSKCQSCERINANRCTVCANGRYGENCDMCSANCRYGSCNSVDGICTHGCKTGYWGDLCEFTCPKQCLGRICLRSNGSCTDGCLGNFTGSKCLCPVKCECSTEGVCERCSSESDYHCDNECRTACVGNLCQRGLQTKCLYGCREGLGGDHCNLKLDSESTKPGTLLVGVVGPFLLVTLIGTVVIVIYRKRKYSRSHRQQAEETPDTLISLNQGGEQDIYRRAKIREKHENPKICKEIQADPISRGALEGLVASKPKTQYQEEFKYILGRSKCLFKPTKQNDAPPGVLNASFIDSSQKRKAYIVCEAPTENTKETFWEMVLKEKCTVIVLISKDFMPQRRDHNTYSPKNDWQHVSGDVNVTFSTESFFKTHRTTDMDIQTPDGDKRVMVLHFIGGFEADTEDMTTASLTNFLTHVRILKTDYPQLVCSSDGVSLCGIYVALDMMIDELESTNQVNIVECVSRLLQQRPDLKQTADEYQIIHKAFVSFHRNLSKKNKTPAPLDQ